MPRIIELGELNVTPADTDAVAVVDVSDTTQAASGSTKKIFLSNFFAALLRIAGHAGFSIPAKATTGTGSLADLVAGANGVLRRSGSGNLAFGTIVEGNIDANAVTTAKIADASVTSAKLSNMPEATLKGRRVGDGTGVPVNVTATEARTILNVADGANNYSHPNHSGDVTSSGDGATTIAADAVTTAKILNANVTTAKIADLNVTEGKLASDSVATAKIANDAVTTAKIANLNVTTGTIADDAVTNAKLANVATQTIKGRTTASTGDPEDLTVAQVLAMLGIQRGKSPTSAPGDTTVTFPTAYAAAPCVFVQVRPSVNDGLMAITTSITTTAFTYRVYNDEGAQSADSVDWLAIAT